MNENNYDNENNWEEEYMQSHMDRMDAIDQIMSDVYNAHKEELLKTKGNAEVRDQLVQDMADEIVMQGGFITHDDAISFIYARLAEDEAEDEEPCDEEVDEEEQGAYEQSHMDRWNALSEIMKTVYGNHEDELKNLAGDELEEKILEVSDEMVDMSGNILMKDEAVEYIRRRLG